MRAPSTRLRNWLRPLTLPMSYVYATAVERRNRRFNRGLGIHRIECPVISIGNITTGGTGKSPMVAWVARFLLSQSRTPVIAMRGYKSQPGEMSDEQAEFRHLLPGVAVLANPDRVAALREFLPHHQDADCILLDDGFQHRRLYRDLDLVLIDAMADTFRDKLLPAGNLREPPSALRRADAVIVTRAEHVQTDLAREIARWHGRPPLAWSKHVWKQLLIRFGPTSLETRPVSWLNGKRVVTMLGVGNPTAVSAQVHDAGARILANIPAGDHEPYDRAKLMTACGLCDGTDGLVVTRKDWVKFHALLNDKLLDFSAPIIVPQVEIEFVAGEGDLQRLITSTVRPSRQSRSSLDGTNSERDDVR